VTFEMPPETLSKVHLEFSSDVRKWFREADGAYQRFFRDRVCELMEGAGERMSHKHKPLEHTKGGSDNSAIWETKLDKGQRILWYPVKDNVGEGRGGKMLMIAYVSKHDAVKTHIRLINGSRQREAAHQAGRTQKEHGGGGAGASAAGADTAADPTDGNYVGSDHPLDPKKNRPWKIHRVKREQIAWLKYSTWEPPLKLSAEEHSVVMGDSPNGVLLLGRSGTGKTICVVSRMDKDRVEHMEEMKSQAVRLPKPKLRQLFVARSGKLCALARNMYTDNINTYKKAGEYSTEDLGDAKRDMECSSHDQVISLMEKRLDKLKVLPNQAGPWKDEHARDTRVTASEFFSQVWPHLVSGLKAQPV
jgi:hypothetical protein